MTNYGSSEGVADLTKPYANANGLFDETTNPTLTKVETWLDQVSAAINIQLAAKYFVTPITAENVTPMLDLFVNKQVSKQVESIHMRGRKGVTNTKSQRDRFNMLADVTTFVEQNARGIGRMGAERDPQFEFFAT